LFLDLRKVSDVSRYSGKILPEYFYG